MRRLMKGRRRGEKGFTLIELLIVVAILGILAAVVIPNVGAFMTTGKLNAANTELENVKTASLAYYAENSVWPTDSGDLGGFLSGVLGGTYTFDTGYGWVTGGTPVALGPYVGLNWQAGLAGAAGYHGKWIR